MKLKGSELLIIQYVMKRAEELGRANDPVEIRLRIKGKAEKVKSYLEKNYKATNLKYLKLINSLLVNVPAKNLRDLVEDNYIERYEFPGAVDVLRQLLAY